MELTKKTGELLIMTETPTDTQKKLRTWLTTGYTITILNQVAMDRYLITTIIRK